MSAWREPPLCVSIFQVSISFYTTQLVERRAERAGIGYWMAGSKEQVFDSTKEFICSKDNITESRGQRAKTREQRADIIDKRAEFKQQRAES
jgi:hypothetical protein